MEKLSLLEVLENIEDPRRERSVIYPLHEVLFIMLTAIICGATSYKKIEMFGIAKQAWLKKYITLEYGIPEACTFRNIIKQIDTEQVHKVFVKWMRAVIGSNSGVIAIDGKEARGTKSQNKKPLHVVSAFSTECELVLGQLACEEKSNEITAIPKLLKILELKGCIVTIDAMGTQTNIADTIVEKDADYILALKRNQRDTYDNVKLYFEDEEIVKSISLTANYAVSDNKGHDRFEKRECYISNDIDWLPTKSKWNNLNGVGMIIATTEENSVIRIQKHYFIYSCKNMNAMQIMNTKREHWNIENKLHWVLDMQIQGLLQYLCKLQNMKFKVVSIYGCVTP